MLGLLYCLLGSHCDHDPGKEERDKNPDLWYRKWTSKHGKYSTTETYPLVQCCRCLRRDFLRYCSC